MSTKKLQILGSMIPDALPNPYKLKFTGNATGEYDGSQAVTVDIPVVTDGYTPVKGIDYYTEEDKDELLRQFASEVIIAQPEAPIDTSAIWIDTDDNYDDGFQDAVNMALAQAKASGEFDGKDGETPVKGTDYFTADDKTEMVNAVIAALPVYNGEVV